MEGFEVQACRPSSPKYALRPGQTLPDEPEDQLGSGGKGKAGRKGLLI